MRFLRILWVVCQLSVSCLSVVCQLSVGCLSVLSRALVLYFAGCLSAGCPFLAALWRSQFGPRFVRPVERVCNLPKGKERKSEASCGGGRQSGLPFITKAWQEYRQGSTTPPPLQKQLFRARSVVLCLPHECSCRMPARSEAHEFISMRAFGDRASTETPPKANALVQKACYAHREQEVFTLSRTRLL